MRTTREILVLSVIGCAGLASAARADVAAAESQSPVSRVTVLGDIGYAYPIGAAETGTDTRDVSFGIVPLSLIGSYDFPRGWSATARLRYALNIPTLCASASDCESSLGRDLGLALGIGRVLPRWWHITLHLGFEAGWEWFTTRLSDAGVASSRSWNGPFASLDLFADLRSGGPWSLGPAIGIDAGVFSHSDLDTPAGHTGGSPDAAIHLWPTISFRVGRRL